jgi:uncharacterized protein
MEDLHETLAGSSPHLRFSIAFSESPRARLVRRSGNDVNVLNQVKQVPEVCGIYCATANPVEVIVAQTDAGRAICGVVDGGAPLGVETNIDIASRHDLLRKITYKL